MPKVTVPTIAMEECMRQLVGLPCVLCQKKIDSITEGGFCPECGSPVHCQCLKPDSTSSACCPACGVINSLAEGNKAQKREEKSARVTAEVSSEGIWKIGWGAVWLLAGAALSVSYFLALVYGGFGIFAIGFLVYGIIQIRNGVRLLKS
jgi:hypothetical protein